VGNAFRHGRRIRGHIISEVLGRAKELIAEGNALLVTADVRMDGESLRITAQRGEFVG